MIMIIKNILFSVYLYILNSTWYQIYHCIPVNKQIAYLKQIKLENNGFILANRSIITKRIFADKNDKLSPYLLYILVYKAR